MSKIIKAGTSAPRMPRYLVYGRSKQGKTTFASFPHQQVSVFQIGGKCLESEGLKWELYPFSELWQGTLNEAIEYSFTINSDSTYLVYQTHKPKEYGLE